MAKHLKRDQALEKGPWRSEHWWVSHYNFYEEIQKDFAPPPEIIIHDSTLRDGEQASGVIFGKEDKIRIAHMLNEIGVQFIEAGFPAVSEQDRDTIKAIAREKLEAKITCLCRAMQKDIEAAVECGVWGAIVEVPVGYPRLKYQFEWSEQSVLEKVLSGVEYAKKLGLYVYLFLIDTGRVRLPFLKQLLLETVSTKNIDRISIVDTTGCLIPEGMKFLVSTVRKWVGIPLEVHCHNDFGLATANSLAGAAAGATSVATTVNGLGQRAGNAPMEEVIMGLKVLYNIPNHLNTKKLIELSRFVQALSGYRVPPNKPIVGENIFTWEAGIPIAALMKLPQTVEPFLPEVLGCTHNIVLGKKGGKASILWKLKELNLDLKSENEVEEVLKRVKTAAIEKKGALTDFEFRDIVDSVNR